MHDTRFIDYISSLLLGRRQEADMEKKQHLNTFLIFWRGEKKTSASLSLLYLSSSIDNVETVEVKTRTDIVQRF